LTSPAKSAKLYLKLFGEKPMMLKRVVMLLVCVGLVSGCQVLDSLLENDPMTPQRPIENETLNETLNLIDFTDSTAIDAWYTVNDDVMGGVSESFITHDGQVALFGGNISFENNGGFATIQTNFTSALDLSTYSGIEITIKGDGKQYGMYMRNSFRSLVYQAVFQTTADEWTILRLPFSQFLPTSFGRTVNGDPFNPQNIVSMSLIIEYKQEGQFALQVEFIKAYR
jgi:NADH dehydrogenase [ubiquinone] 1 alpha subcomplex assembly factor 1